MDRGGQPVAGSRCAPPSCALPSGSCLGCKQELLTSPSQPWLPAGTRTNFGGGGLGRLLGVAIHIASKDGHLAGRSGWGKTVAMRVRCSGSAMLMLRWEAFAIALAEADIRDPTACSELSPTMPHSAGAKVRPERHRAPCIRQMPWGRPC